MSRRLLAGLWTWIGAAGSRTLFSKVFFKADGTDQLENRIVAGMLAF